MVELEYPKELQRQFEQAIVEGKYARSEVLAIGRPCCSISGLPWTRCDRLL